MAWYNTALASNMTTVIEDGGLWINGGAEMVMSSELLRANQAILRGDDVYLVDGILSVSVC